MALAAVIAAIGVAVAATGAVISYSAAKSAQSAQQQNVAAQQQQNALAQQQMNLDATRRKREIIRAAQAARSQALSTETAQGATGNGGSSLAGAYGSIAGRTNVNALGVDQNQSIGNSMFASKNAQYNAEIGMSQAQSFGALGSGLSSLGGAIMTNNVKIGQIGTQAGSYFSNAGNSFFGGGSPSGYGR